MRDRIAFTKMNGLGNDFVVVDARASGIRLLSDQIRRISDRQSGIGCDQFIQLEPPRPGTDVFMRIYNGIGKEVEACGNATRCIAHVMMEETGKDHAAIETVAGILIGYRDVTGRQVTVDMGPPHLNWDEIPLAEPFHDTRAIELQIGPIDDPILHTPAVVNMGNPHAIFFVDDLERFDLGKIGPMLENHPIFPERANISLAKVETPERVIVKVWERDAGLTSACGSAACAVAVAGVRLRHIGRRAEIVLPGGSLTIEWRERDSHVLMTGPFQIDYSGTIAPDLLAETA
ncbi:MAG: diaminopimelate epimerase [Pseudomonadota bacterium]